MDAMHARRRRRLRAGIYLLLASLALEAALFTTPLERRVLNTSAWFAIVLGVQTGSLALLGSVWSATRDALGLSALIVAVVALVSMLALVVIFVEIAALTGLR